MKSVALYFAIVWVLVSSVIFGFTTSSYLANIDTFGKEGLFVVVLSLIVVVLGIFFAINYQKISLYLSNYKREKHI